MPRSGLQEEEEKIAEEEKKKRLVKSLILSQEKGKSSREKLFVISQNGINKYKFARSFRNTMTTITTIDFHLNYPIEFDYVVKRERERDRERKRCNYCSINYALTHDIITKFQLD